MDQQNASHEPTENRRAAMLPGPWTCGVIGSFLLINVLIPWSRTTSNPPDGHVAAVIALTFGYVACLAVWAFADELVHPSRQIWLTYAVAAAVGPYLALIDYIQYEREQLALCVVFYVLFATLVFALMSAGDIVEGLAKDLTKQSKVRFGVKHLLYLMCGVALVAIAIKLSIAAWQRFLPVDFLVLTLQCAATTTLAGQLLLVRSPNLPRFALLVVGSLGIGITAQTLSLNSPLVPWHYVSLFLVAVLTFGIIVPQLDSRPAWRAG